MSNFIDVEDLLTKRRNILSRYSDSFNISSHHPFEKVPTESAASAPINFIQTAVSAIILMSALVLIFIMDIGAIFSVVLSILSISCGTVGYLHLWNVNLDAVSLISMLMSIGFSVDYSAHICYHYFTMTYETKTHKPSLARKFLNQLKPSTDP
uniref:Patched domain-containing protein 3 n=1 Tax=Panagrolaimus sp. JU765 TaxID=591449 RepID=A0AC34QF86_9BILA